MLLFVNTLHTEKGEKTGSGRPGHGPSGQQAETERVHLRLLQLTVTWPHPAQMSSRRPVSHDNAGVQSQGWKSCSPGVGPEPSLPVSRLWPAALWLQMGPRPTLMLAPHLPLRQVSCRRPALQSPNKAGPRPCEARSSPFPRLSPLPLIDSAAIVLIVQSDKNSPREDVPGEEGRRPSEPQPSQLPT